MERTLREELKSQNPVLYSAFERSLEIAMTQWLPNVPPNMDSYNSYPHILGVEYHLNDILYRKNAPAHIITLNPTEIYILLCSILFHDIGKSKPGDNKNKKQEDNHSEESENLIKKKWAELGIVSERLAWVIGTICRFHDDNSSNAIEKLSDVYEIDRYDPIRGRKLGALLKLADNLDDTFSRVVPSYLFNKEFIEEYNKELQKTLQTDHNPEYISKHIKEKDVHQIVGEFRMRIQSVKVDYETKIVRTVLDRYYFYRMDIFTGDKNNIYGDLHDYFDKNIPGNDENLDKKLIEKLTEGNCILFTIARDVYKNNIALGKIRNELYAMHIPIDKWVIECDKHLFGIKWEKENTSSNEYKVKAVNEDYKNEKFVTSETVEPIISYEYCSNVLKGIIRLSGRSFGKTFHTYEKLLRYVREDAVNTEKIKCAVKRLSVLLDYDDKIETGVKIYYDNVGWNIATLMIDNKEQKGNCIDEKEADALIKKLDKILNIKVGKNDETR